MNLHVPYLTEKPRVQEERHVYHMAHRRALERQPFTQEERDHWAPMLHATWQAIGADAEQGMRGSGQKLTKAIIIEFVIDANRVQQYGGMTDAEYEFLCVCSHRHAVKQWLREELNY